MGLNEQIAEAVKILEGETAILRDVQRNLAEFRRAEADSLNRVNEAQKKVDQLIDEMRKTAAPGTGWYSERIVRHPA